MTPIQSTTTTHSFDRHQQHSFDRWKQPTFLWQAKQTTHSFLAGPNLNIPMLLYQHTTRLRSFYDKQKTTAFFLPASENDEPHQAAVYNVLFNSVVHCFYLRKTLPTLLTKQTKKKVQLFFFTTLLYEFTRYRKTLAPFCFFRHMIPNSFLIFFAHRIIEDFLDGTHTPFFGIFYDFWWTTADRRLFLFCNNAPFFFFGFYGDGGERDWDGMRWDERVRGGDEEGMRRRRRMGMGIWPAWRLFLCLNFFRWISRYGNFGNGIGIGIGTGTGTTGSFWENALFWRFLESGKWTFVHKMDWWMEMRWGYMDLGFGI